MDADDCTRLLKWSSPSAEHFDQLALGVLRAARTAAQELQRDPPDPDRRMWAIGRLAGQVQAMLGPDLPDYPPLGEAAQEGFIRTALALAIHVRAHSWADNDLAAPDVRQQDDEPHPVEQRTADAFDALGRLMLPHSSPEGWTATLVTDFARSDKKLELAVRIGKYILHPTFLTLVDDTTRELGEALHNINVDRFHELASALRDYACAEAASTVELGVQEPGLFDTPNASQLDDLAHSTEALYNGEDEELVTDSLLEDLTDCTEVPYDIEDKDVPGPVERDLRRRNPRMRGYHGRGFRP